MALTTKICFPPVFSFFFKSLWKKLGTTIDPVSVCTRAFVNCLKDKLLVLRSANKGTLHHSSGRILRECGKSLLRKSESALSDFTVDVVV